MSKRTYLLLTLALIAIVPAGEVHAAFWDGVGKMSGPGPFTGFDLVYPFRIGATPARLGVGMLDHPGTRMILNNYYLPFRLEVEPLVLARNEELVRKIGERYDFQPFREWTSTGKDDEPLEQELEQRLDEFLDSRAAVRQQRSQEQGAPGATQTLREFNQWVLTQDAEVFAYFKSRYRVPGWSKVFGLFTSTAALELPEVDDNGNLVMEDGATRNVASNNYLTVAVAFLWSVQNDLPYPDSSTSSKTVGWITVYPAYERRFRASDSGETNWFVNTGPAIHQFRGEAFDTFYKVSLRSRVGFRYRQVSFGGQGEYFVDDVEHSEFGAADTRTHRWGYGGFVNFELPGFSR